MDIGLALLGLTASLPLIAGAVVATRLSGDRGALLDRATPVGEDGRPIIVYKLRMIRVAAPGLAITSGDDTRITQVGRVLRWLKLDELPQT